jgi:hypothetical protein
MSSKKVRAGASIRESFEAIYPGVSQKVAYDGSVQSAALTAGVSVIRLVSTTACHVKTGSNPTAVADGTCVYLPANTPLMLGVSSGDKVAAIKDATGGNLFITEGLP